MGSLSAPAGLGSHRGEVVWVGASPTHIPQPGQAEAGEQVQTSFRGSSEASRDSQPPCL